MSLATPYVHVLFQAATEVESGDFDRHGVVFEAIDGYHALFAAQIILRPFERIDAIKWGWTARDLLLEVMDRQLRFLASLYAVDPDGASPNPGLRTVSLRYLRRPGSAEIDLALVGKVFAPSADEARESAAVFWQELAALFPYDYELVPALSCPAFREICGLALIASAGASLAAAEVRRYEMFISKPGGYPVTEGDYVPYPFVWHPYAMEQVWRAMALLPSPSLVDVMLRPTYLYEAEEMHLNQLCAAAERLAASDRLPLRKQGALAAQLYAESISQLRHPYLMRVQVLADRVSLMPVARGVGTALSTRLLAQPEHPPEAACLGYELALPAADELSLVMKSLDLLEFYAWGRDQAALPYRRFRYLFDAPGVHCAFRLPLIPKAGLPGIRFRVEPLAL